MPNVEQSLGSVRGRQLFFDTSRNLVLDGQIIGNSPAQSPILWGNAPAPQLSPSLYFEIFDDFLNPATSAVSDVTAWSAVNDGTTGTPVYQDAAGGVFNVVTSAADNDYAAYKSLAQPFLFAAGKELWFEARFRLAEATTSESTWWFGLSDTTTTGGMQANAAGPLASYDGALIWKTPETALTVNFETSNAGTQNTLSAFATAVDNTWTRVGFYFDGAATTSAITPYIDLGAGAGWVAGGSKTITLAGLEEMNLIYGVKAGPTAGAETLQIDYIRCVQKR